MYVANKSGPSILPCGSYTRGSLIYADALDTVSQIALKPFQ